MMRHTVALLGLAALFGAGTARAQAPAPGGAGDTAVPGPQDIATITVGQTRTGLLEAGDWTMNDATWADVWYLNLAAGQRVTIDLKSRPGRDGFDAYLQLLDPWGNKLAEDDDSGGNGDARIIFAAREAGRYQLVVNNFGDTPQGGHYTLAVR